MAIEVAKVELKTVQDASGLEACIKKGQFSADQVIAVIGKTEGNGGVNDLDRLRVRLGASMARLCPRSRMPSTGVLPTGAATGLELLVLVLVRLDSADVGFVDFDDALAAWSVSPPQASRSRCEHEPRRLLRDADLLGELHARRCPCGP